LDAYSRDMTSPERAPARLHHTPEAVRWARERAGLTQTQLAERAGHARTLVVEIEGGTRNATPAYLLKLAEALNCPLLVTEAKREAAPRTRPRGARTRASRPRATRKSAATPWPPRSPCAAPKWPSARSKRRAINVGGGQ